MIDNLRQWFARADCIDIAEGVLAYPRYHQVMTDFSQCYDVPKERVVAAFVALSPNNDYYGNLRSLASVLHGVRTGKDWDKIVVSTYGHCKTRALQYVVGSLDFLTTARGHKIKNFYHNIITPTDNRYVTIDGHMSSIWNGKIQTMKEAIIKPHQYRVIADAVKLCAFEQFLLPNQYQAILWFTRKRVLRVRYDGQLALFSPRDDVWQTLRDVSKVLPYP